MLVVMSGLPGVGKSAVAEGVARELAAALLSVDPIEAAMWRAGVERTQPTGLAAYGVAATLAGEQLRLGGDVVVDAVNGVDEAWQMWRGLAEDHATALRVVEVVCSDSGLHRRRLADRRRGIDGFPEPSWTGVQRRPFTPWPDERLVLDSVDELDRNIEIALAYIRGGDQAGRRPARHVGAAGNPDMSPAAG